MRELLYDNFDIRGTDIESLISFSDTYDTMTCTDKIDFSDVEIYTMIGMGSSDFATRTIPGTQLRINKGTKPWTLEAPDIVKSNVGALERNGYTGLARELMYARKYHGTYFKINNNFWYTSNACAKTLANRFEVNPKSSVERDILMAHNIADLGKNEFWVVSRKSGNNRKIFGIFSKKPKNLPMRDVICEILEKDDVNVLGWDYSQDLGFTVWFESKSMMSVVGKQNGLLPCYILHYCDTGHVANSISSAWRPADGRLVYEMTYTASFANRDNKKTEDMDMPEAAKWQMLYEKAQEKILESVEVFADTDTVTYDGEDELLDLVIRMADKSGILSKISKKNLEEIKQEIRNYVAQTETHEISVGELKSLLMFSVFRITEAAPDYTAKMLMSEFGDKIVKIHVA